MSASDEFKTYSWETDEGWIKIEKRIEFPADIGPFKKRRFLEKKKLKYYKKNVNPDYDPNAVKEEEEAKPEPKPKETVPPETESKEEEAQETKSKTEPEPPKQEKPSPTTESESSNEKLASGTFVKLNLTNAKYNGLMGEIGAFLPETNRYLVRLHLPETRVSQYRQEIKVKPDNITPASKFPVYGEMLAHIMFIVCFALSILSSRFYSRALYISIVIHGLSLLYLKGKPQMTPQFAQEALQCPQSMYLVCSLALLMAGPMFVFLAPPLCRHVNRGFGMLSALMKNDQPSLYAKLKPVIDPVLERRSNFKKLAVTMEVYLGIFCIVGLVLRTSSFATIFIYWNFLRIKYMCSQETKLAFRELKYTIDQKLSGFPAVMPYWNKVCDFLYSYVDEIALQRQAQQAQTGGMMGRLKSMCSVM